MIIIGIDLGEIRIKSISHSQHDNSKHCQLDISTQKYGRAGKT
jgi:hypothetical protein